MGQVFFRSLSLSLSLSLALSLVHSVCPRLTISVFEVINKALLTYFSYLSVNKGGIFRISKQFKRCDASSLFLDFFFLFFLFFVLRVVVERHTYSLKDEDDDDDDDNNTREEEFLFFPHHHHSY